MSTDNNENLDIENFDFNIDESDLSHLVSATSESANEEQQAQDEAAEVESTDFDMQMETPQKKGKKKKSAAPRKDKNSSGLGAKVAKGFAIGMVTLMVVGGGWFGLSYFLGGEIATLLGTQDNGYASHAPASTPSGSGANAAFGMSDQDDTQDEGDTSAFDSFELNQTDYNSELNAKNTYGANDLADALGAFGEDAETADYEAEPSLHIKADGTRLSTDLKSRAEQFSDGDVVLSPYSASSAPSQELSDEERMYDALLEQADKLDVPLEAIKIDRSVVDARVQSQRLDSFEREIKSAQTDIKNISEVLTTIREQTGSLQTAIERNAQSNNELRKSIESIEAALNKQSQTTKKELDALKKQVAQAPSAPEPAVAPAPAVAKVTPAATPKTTPVASKPVAPKPAPKPAPRPAPRQQAAAPAACASNTYSTLWRVAGANASSAYVLRLQDNYGLLVKVGSRIPGFGTVQSFDVNARTVCTTQGIIKR